MCKFGGVVEAVKFQRRNWNLILHFAIGNRELLESIVNTLGTSCRCMCDAF